LNFHKQVFSDKEKRQQVYLRLQKNFLSKVSVKIFCSEANVVGYITDAENFCNPF